MRPGAGAVRLWRLAGESARVARSQPVSSAVTALIVAGVCGVILGTTGQTVQAERQVLGRIDEAGTRSIVVSDTQGGAGFTAATVQRVAGLSRVEWAFGLGPAVDVRPVGNPGGNPVAMRALYGEPPAPLSLAEWDRAPGTLLVGPHAQAVLGMLVPAGGVSGSDDTDLAVVGSFRAGDPLTFLERSALTAPTDTNGVVRTIHVLAQRPEDVAPLAEAVRMVLGPEDPGSVAIETSETLAQIRAAIQGELGEYGRRLVLMVLGAGLVLVALNVYGTVTTRRRDFGRRRALGADRTAITTLVTMQALITGLIGAVLGSAAGSAIVWRVTRGLPDLRFVVAVAVLAVTATVLAALPPAVVAARRDPVRVLRVP
jgi:putative ABC transport system permease protein